MKSKLALLTAALSVAAIAPAFADDDFKHHMVSGGWLYIDPQTESTPLATRFFAGPAAGSTVTSPGTSATISKESTLGLTYTYLVDDHWSMEFIGGLPPKFDLSASGQSTFGDLSTNKPLATVKQWSPTLLGIYTFLDHTHKVRPYVGMGLVYTRFTDIKLNPAFVQQVKTAAAGFGPVNVSATADDNVAPVVTLGMNYEFAKDWYGILSASYSPVETNANVLLTSGLNGSQLAYSSTHVKLDPLVTYLGVGYRF